MLKYIDRIPLLPLAIAATVVALAPFTPAPHLLEKSRLLINGELINPVDIFDLFWHSFLLLLLVIRLMRFKSSATD